MTTPIITKENVTEHSKSWKRIVEINDAGLFNTRDIQLRALNFLNNDCFGDNCYDKEKKAYICGPFTLKGKEATIKYHKGGFKCNCKTFKEFDKIDDVPGIAGLVCEHILTLKLKLKIWNNEKKRDKEEFGCDAI